MGLSTKLPYELLLTQWSQALNPLLASPTASPSLITDVALLTGTNIINHKLGQKLKGYVVVLKSAASIIYDSQQTNPSPDKTLILNASADATISLLVF